MLDKLSTKSSPVNPSPYIYKTHPRSRSIKISINQTGEVVVTSPKWTPKWAIKKFIESSKPWIEQHVTQVKQRANFGVQANEGLIFGKKYQKIIRVIDHLSHSQVKVEAQQLIIELPSDKSEKFGTDKLNGFLRRTAEKYLLPRTKQLADKMKIDYGRITLREQKTRWGSCSSTGNLNFNWRLVHAPPAVIDYVIIHELAHRKHMDHSTNFWALVERFDPEYKSHRGWLKRRGMGLD